MRITGIPGVPFLYLRTNKNVVKNSHNFDINLSMTQIRPAFYIRTPQSTSRDIEPSQISLAKSHMSSTPNAKKYVSPPIIDIKLDELQLDPKEQQALLTSLQLLENDTNSPSRFDELGNLSLRVYADGGIYVHHPIQGIKTGENEMCGLVAVQIGQLNPAHTTVIQELNRNSANNIEFVGSQDEAFMNVVAKIASSIRDGFPKNPGLEKVGIRSSHDDPDQVRQLLTKLSQAA